MRIIITLSTYGGFCIITGRHEKYGKKENKQPFYPHKCWEMEMAFIEPIRN